MVGSMCHLKVIIFQKEIKKSSYKFFLLGLKNSSICMAGTRKPHLSCFAISSYDTSSHSYHFVWRQHGCSFYRYQEKAIFSFKSTENSSYLKASNKITTPLAENLWTSSTKKKYLYCYCNLQRYTSSILIKLGVLSNRFLLFESICKWTSLTNILKI